MIVIPAAFRRRYRLSEGDIVIAEETEQGVLLRPAVAVPVEVYSPQRRAEFLLSNAVDCDDYEWAVAEVRSMGLDPETIPHTKPGARSSK